MPEAAVAKPGSRGGFPGRRVGGGSRSDCLTKAPLVALSPKTNFGKTTAAYPTVYFSLPSEERSFKVKFALKDESGMTLARRQFVTEAKPGIVGVNLAAVSQTGLDVNQNYRWYLSVACTQEQSQNLIVDGWIRRVKQEPQTAQAKQTLDSIRQTWKSGLWHDAVAALLELRQAQPQNEQIAALWNEMLKSEKLPQTTSVPNSNMVQLNTIAKTEQRQF